MGKLQHHSGQRKDNKGDNNKNVRNPLVLGKTPEIQITNFFWSLFFLLASFLDGPGQPHQQMDPEEGENGQQ